MIFRFQFPATGTRNFLQQKMLAQDFYQNTSNSKEMDKNLYCFLELYLNLEPLTICTA